MDSNGEFITFRYKKKKTTVQFVEERSISFMGNDDVEELLSHMVQNDDHNALVNGEVIIFKTGAMISLASRALVPNVFSSADYIETLYATTKIIFKKDSILYTMNSPSSREISCLPDLPLFEGLESVFLNK